MTCEQFGQQACVDNDRAADRIGLMLDQGDPAQAANAIRQELYDRPQPLQLDLLERIRHYDERGTGADLRISPIVQQYSDGYGGSQYVDTGDREVAVDSQNGSEQVAIITGAPQRRYQQYDELRNIDPFAAITSMFVGQLLNGRFNQWQHMPRRHDFWQDQSGRMWYPENGSWRHQGMGPSQFYQGVPGQFNSRRFFPERQDNGPAFGSAEWHRQRESHNWRDSVAPEGSPGWQRRQQWLREQAIREQREKAQRETPGTPEWWEQKKRSLPQWKQQGNPMDGLPDRLRHTLPQQGVPRDEMPRRDGRRWVQPDGQRHIQPEGQRHVQPEGQRHVQPWQDRRFDGRQDVKPRFEAPRQELPRQEVPRHVPRAEQPRVGPRPDQQQRQPRGDGQRQQIPREQHQPGRDQRRRNG